MKVSNLSHEDLFEKAKKTGIKTFSYDPENELVDITLDENTNSIYTVDSSFLEQFKVIFKNTQWLIERREENGTE